ncbi:hypothetical protein RvY_04739 [Ramazzottius varieornatus]|uniref:Protein sleepless n=1 Tax=Ramazzottius varieornatus TaxID=947166 RepID=A0A1D1UVY4_RAMVA|nr:hypothetical protein RvY_04739 [Ramazzottius varieornatus]
MSTRGIVLAFVLLVSIIAAATALRCYSCSPQADPSKQIVQCVTAADPTTLRDCGNTVSVCFKTRVQVGGSSTTEQITRGCGKYTGDGSQGLGDNQCQDHDINGVKTNICNCNTDSCNGAAKISSMATAMSIIFALVIAKMM